MAHEFTTSYIKDSLSLFRYYKRLAERAIEQAPDEALFTSLDAESNSIAVIVKHMSGNMRSRWRDFYPQTARSPTAIATPNSKLRPQHGASCSKNGKKDGATFSPRLNPWATPTFQERSRFAPSRIPSCRRSIARSRITRTTSAKSFSSRSISLPPIGARSPFLAANPSNSPLPLRKAAHRSANKRYARE